MINKISKIIHFLFNIEFNKNANSDDKVSSYKRTHQSVAT